MTSGGSNGWKADIATPLMPLHVASMKMPTTLGSSIDVQGSLEEAILACTDMAALYELLDKQAMVAAPSDKLDSYLRRFIDAPVPYLTAKVFRVYRHTASKDLSLHAAAASYLSVSCYDGDWYDETINSIGWANELLSEGSDSPLVTAYRNLIVEAEEQGHDELLKFCGGYSR
jgi:hypothetical protein